MLWHGILARIAILELKANDRTHSSIAPLWYLSGLSHVQGKEVQLYGVQEQRWTLTHIKQGHPPQTHSI